MDNSKNRHAFTLLELILVCFIISLIIGFVIPNLYNRIPGLRIENEVRKLSQIITWTLNESVSTGLPLQIQYDLHDDTYWINMLTEINPETEKPERAFLTKLTDLVFTEIHFGEGNVLTSESLVVDVHPEGYIDPHRIYLEDKDHEKAFTLVVNPVTGFVETYNYRFFPE